MDITKKSELFSKYDTLQSHWNIKSKMPWTLNPRESDYHFKSHLSRLHKTYTRLDGPYNSPPRRDARAQSIGSQLFGYDGIMRKDAKEQRNYNLKREDSWDDRFNRFKAEEKLQPKSLRRPNSAPSTRRYSKPSTENDRTKESLFASQGRLFDGKEFDTQYRQELRKNIKHLKLSRSDMRIVGLYHLPKEQEKIYDDFVRMISSMDSFDRKHILQDVEYEAEKRSEMLEAYDGIASNFHGLGK